MEKQINEIKINIMEFKKDIGYIKKSLDKNEEAHKEIMEKIDVWFNAAESRFAGKWVEKIAIAVGSVIGVTLIGAILSLVILK